MSSTCSSSLTDRSVPSSAAVLQVSPTPDSCQSPFWWTDAISSANRFQLRAVDFSEARRAILCDTRWQCHAFNALLRASWLRSWDDLRETTQEKVIFHSKSAMPSPLIQWRYEWRLFIFISRESKWGTLQSAGNPRCAVPAEILDLHWSPWPRPGRGSTSVPHLGYLSVSRRFNE